MGVIKKVVKQQQPKPTTSSVKKAKDFDDFLETLDDSDDSEIDNSEDEEEDGVVDDHQGVKSSNGVAARQPQRNGKQKIAATADESDEDEEELEEELGEEEQEENSGDDDEELEEEEDDEELEITEEASRQSGSRVGNAQKKVDNEDEDNSSDEEEEDDGQDLEQTAAEHKKALQRLQETDPDFFDYLKENDADLLNFEDSGDDSGSEDDEEAGGALHKPPEELEEASDSEAEEERMDTESTEYKGKVEKLVAKGIVSLEVIQDWETKMSTTRDITVLVNVIEAFECAVHQILEDESSTKQKWKVDGSANFNALVRLCITHVKGFCVRYLCGSNNLAVSEQKFDQRPLEFKEKSSQKWSKLRSKLKSYMATLVKFLKSMGNSDAVASILRHCQKMSGFWALLASKSYKLLRTLIHIWSAGEDSCRILAFLTIIRMANYNREAFLLRIYKQMYLAYVANCKFTSANTWPALNLMRSSLTEVFLLDSSLAYSVAFPFIRQLAIHLRNALTAGTTAPAQTKQNKKEASRIVYSWQFLHSLNLWADLLSHSNSSQDENLKLLIYPVVQICLGTIKLIPTKKYIPLRFLIVRMLIKLQEKTGVFIPILPLITEVLLMTDFSIKSVSKFSVRPLDMTCCLKADATESGYGKAVSENVFELILRTCKAIATDLSFPEIVTPTLMQLRSFLKKKCKNPEVCRKYKTLMEKMDANSKYISDKRSKALDAGSVSLSDMESQKILRVQMETTKPHPPILEFANEYLKVHARTQAKLRKINVETREEKLIPRRSGINASRNKLPSKKSMLDSDEDDSDDSEFKTKLDPEIELEEDAATCEEEDREQPTKSKKKLKLKRKLEEKAVEQPQGKVKKSKKNKSKKSKLQAEFEADDELVELEFSD